MRVAAAKLQIAFGPNHKEAQRLLQLIEPGKVEVAAIHNEVGAGLGHQDIEDVDVVHLAVRDIDKHWNGAAQIDHRMQLHGALGPTKVCPREQGEAQIDRGGVQSIHGSLEVEPEILVGIERTGDRDQAVRKVGIDPPVAGLVGLGESRALHGVAKARVVQLAVLYPQTHFDVAQTLAIGQLCERHTQELFPTRQAPHPAVALVAGDAPIELVVRQERGDLCKDGLSLIHCDSPPSNLVGEESHSASRSSNRLDPSCRVPTAFSRSYAALTNR